MWFLVAAIAAAFVLSIFLAPKPQIENARAATLSDFNFPRAKEGDPVPRVYGTVKTRGANTIGLGDFLAEPVTKKVKTGLFSSKEQVVGYQYKIGLDLAVALGPCVTFRRMWFGKNEVWNGCITECTDVTSVDIDLPELYGGEEGRGGVGGRVNFYSGNFDQSQDAYFATLFAEHGTVPAYVGVAHATFEQFWFGNTPSIEPIYFEVSHFSDSLGLSGIHIMPNQFDANAIEVLYDIFTNDWGNLDVDPALIDTDNWIEAASVLWYEGNGVSVEVANPQQGKDIAREILRQINAILFQDPATGLIKIKLIRADYVIGELPVFGPDQVKVVRNYTTKLWKDTINRVRIKFEDRSKGYSQDTPAMADDFANIRFQQRIRAVDIGMPCLKDPDLANQLAARELSNLSVPLFQAELETNRETIELGPGGVFVLQWAEYNNLTQLVCRIRKFSLGTREDGKITMHVTQDEFALDDIVFSKPEIGLGDTTDYSPQDIANFDIFELPYFLFDAAGFEVDEAETRYAAFAARPGAASLDFDMLVEDGDEDTEILSNAPYSYSAVLDAAIARWADFDTGIIPEVDISSVTNPAELEAATTAGVRSGANLIYAGGEIWGFETVTDNGGGSYTLGNVHRALIDTAWLAHAAGDRIWFFNGQEGFADFGVPIDPLEIYLLDRTIQGRSSEAGATKEALTPVGRMFLPAPPDWITVETEREAEQVLLAGETVTVDWLERNRTDGSIRLEADATQTPEAGTTYRIELRQGETVLESASGLSATTHELDIPLDAEGSAEIWVTAVLAGEDSFTPAVYPINIVQGGARVTEAAHLRVDESGDTRGLEG